MPRIFWTNAAVEESQSEILARSAERSSQLAERLPIRIRQNPRAPGRPLARGDGIDVLRIRPASSDWFGSLDLPTP